MEPIFNHRRQSSLSNITENIDQVPPPSSPNIINDKSEKFKHENEEDKMEKKEEDYDSVNEDEEEDTGSEDDDDDEFGLDPRDIDLMMSETGLSWNNAAKALKDANNCFITAIMENQKN
ncbi:nascent polypeptide-associated complex subunit alpha-like [Gastrolobium bilobum]|uniref:nascent polypeptide-associated complex subunit alpha-like n=1 Tax=Gastrolobium bilobum TaxID=150636 RepID=UPI002AAF6EFE|nr:nascent polypeptide-associated complex subunit alpha-like [Gastrolobium bilobum]